MLLALLALPFAADCDALGHRDFAVRHAATQRLHSRGYAALPALLLVSEDAQPERSRRAADLIERLKPLSLLLAERLVAADADAVPDAALLPLRAALCCEFDRLGTLRVRNPQWQSESTLSGGRAIYEWSLKPAHYGGSQEAELRLLLEAARERRRELVAAAASGAAAAKRH